MMSRHAPGATSQAIPGSTVLFTADQMDDLHWFFHGFVNCYALSSLKLLMRIKMAIKFEVSRVLVVTTRKEANAFSL
jgi:hypothetical protein